MKRADEKQLPWCVSLKKAAEGSRGTDELVSVLYRRKQVDSTRTKSGKKKGGV